MKNEKSGMIDNKMVSDNHQQGIERVKQRGMQKGQGGCMSWKGESDMENEKGSFKREDSITPRRA